jgi:plastocyanin
MNQKMVIGIIAVLIIIVGALYYYSGYNYGTPSVSGTPNPQAQNQISIKNFAFGPAVLNIQVGDTVTWVNNDSATHRIKGGNFESSDMANGQSYSFKFTSAGTFDYICSIHPSMKGTIIVK